MKYRGGFVFLWPFYLLLSCQLWAAAPTFEVPPLTGPVVDQAGMLSQNLKLRLSDYLERLYDSGGTQVQVVTLSELGDVSVEEAGIKLADAWKLGRKGRDDAVIFLIALKEHKVRIEVGRGHEGELPDILASRIIREQVAPRLKAGQYDEAVRDGVLAIVHLTDPGFAPREARPARQGVDGRGLLFLFILFFFILPLFFRGGGGGGGFLAGAVLGNLLGGGRRGGGWSDGGGGWSGGGGGFGGGGASGDW